VFRRRETVGVGEAYRGREYADTPRPERKHPVGPVPLRVVAKEWTRIGVTGFGGPAAHISMLRRLVVDRHEWMDARSFEHANAACGMLPDPVAAVGYAAHGIAGDVLAAVVVAFTPSFSFILLGGQRLERLRQNAAAHAFLDAPAPPG
jgi:chromate transporter